MAEEVKTFQELSKDSLSMFDSRLHRALVVYGKEAGDDISNGWYLKNYGYSYPHYDYNSYAMEYHETPNDIAKKILELDPEKDQEEIDTLTKQKSGVEEWIIKNYNNYLAPMSFIHPYAMIKLTGATGTTEDVARMYTYDRFSKRRWYEIEGTETGGYAKSPTTTALIRWGNDDPKGRTPYSLQDFVFCKNWNKIQNNRMITLRRYAAPVLDSLDFADDDYKTDTSGTVTNASRTLKPWAPLATAVTYFGKGTGNDLSKILQFSAKYEWEKMSRNDKDPFTISATQSEGGTGFINSKMAALTSGFDWIAKVLGVMGEIDGENTMTIDAVATVPPDPYNTGPYENRILGPVNTISDTYKRNRGLSFTNSGLKLTFEYTARPIAGINSKAIMLDLLSNILVMCYSNGIWYGGAWKYNNDNPALYPFRYGDAMQKLYRGELFGKDGAAQTLIKNVIQNAGDKISSVLPDVMGALGSIVSGAVDSLLGSIQKGVGKLTGNSDMEAAGNEKKEQGAGNLDSGLNSGFGRAMQKVVASKVLKGATIPYIRSQRALLTGDPIGDWHLTIGNPLNPIAMIGNLIVKDLSIEFSDELGPDDFPLGFKAVISLEHGLGRDREAIESMFNRGHGRIYSLPDSFRSSADGETKVDEHTGGVNTMQGRIKYEETRNTYFGGGTRFIAKMQTAPVSNSGTIYKPLRKKSLTDQQELMVKENPICYVNPWQMEMTL